MCDDIPLRDLYYQMTSIDQMSTKINQNMYFSPFFWFINTKISHQY